MMIEDRNGGPPVERRGYLEFCSRAGCEYGLSRVLRVLAASSESAVDKIFRVADHKGILLVDFAEEPTQEDLDSLSTSWLLEGEVLLHWSSPLKSFQEIFRG